MYWTASMTKTENNNKAELFSYCFEWYFKWRDARAEKNLKRIAYRKFSTKSISGSDRVLKLSKRCPNNFLYLIGRVNERMRPKKTWVRMPSYKG